MHIGEFLSIASKMFKRYFSLPFQEALERNSARQIRFAFLLHAWNATLDYSENVLREAEQTDKLFNVRQDCAFVVPLDKYLHSFLEIKTS